MASESAHIAVANRNQSTINHLCSDLTLNSPWIATIGFYKALHVVEAVFSNDPEISNMSDHGTRFEALKKTKRYRHIHKHYSELFRISIVARYLEDESTKASVFDEFLDPEEVAPVALFHHLKQIENSARKRLSNPESLVSVDVAKTVLGR